MVVYLVHALIQLVYRRIERLVRLERPGLLTLLLGELQVLLADLTGIRRLSW